MFKIINKSSYPGNECYEHLAEMCRRATAKDLRGPDERLKQAIVHAINNNSAQATIPPKIVTEILVRRLQMDKPHKQYLAVDLVRKVLADCTDKMRMYRPELLNEIGKISFKAGKNGSVEAQRAAKKAAIDYLMSQGPEGQHALMMAGNGHDANLAQFTTVPRPMPMVYSPTAASGGQLSSPQSTRGTTAQTDFMPTGDTIEDVKQLIELANGHSEVLEELITASRELQGESNPLIKELLDKVTALKQVFPGLLEKLSQIGTPEAEGIMAQALQASDVLDNCLELQSSVRSARQNASAHATPTGTPKASSPQANSGTSAAPPAAEPAAAAAPAAAPAPPPEPKQEIDLLGFDSLASPPKASTTAAAPPANDPFGFMDLTLQDPKAAANGSAAPAAQPPSGNPFEAAAPEAPPTSMPANPFAMPAPAAAPAAAPYNGTAPSYGQQPPPPYGAPPQAANPFGSDMFAGGMANPFQQNSTGFPPAQPPYSQPGPAPGYPQQPLPHNQLPGYMPQQTGMPGYPSAGPPNMAPYGYASPGQAPPMPMYNGNAPSQVAPVQMFNGGFPSPMQPPNPFLPQMPGLPQQASYVPPAKKYTNAFDDLLSDVSARPKSAATPPPMTAPMAKTLASKKAAAAPPAAAAPQHVPAAPAAAPAPAAADPFDLLVAQNAPAHAVANPNMSSEFDALVGR